MGVDLIQLLRPSFAIAEAKHLTAADLPLLPQMDDGLSLLLNFLSSSSLAWTLPWSAVWKEGLCSLNLSLIPIYFGMKGLCSELNKIFATSLLKLEIIMQSKQNSTWISELNYLSYKIGFYLPVKSVPICPPYLFCAPCLQDQKRPCSNSCFASKSHGHQWPWIFTVAFFYS